MIAQELVDFYSKMRKHKIKQVELARRLKVSKTYVNEVLNDKRPWVNALPKFNAALDELIAEKSSPD